MATLNFTLGTPSSTTKLVGFDTASAGGERVYEVDDLPVSAAQAAADAAVLSAATDRNNHTGTQSADTIVDGTTNKAFTSAEKTKLAGVSAGATANSSDATLLDRNNHTGTQSADTIVDGTTNKAFTAAEKTKLGAISGTNTGDQTASTVANTPAGNIAATTVQGALNELDSEKVAIANKATTPQIAAGTADKWVDAAGLNAFIPPCTLILRDAPATNVVETDAVISAGVYRNSPSVRAVLGGRNTTSVASGVNGLSAAFDNCPNLQVVSLPAATSIGDFAFSSCTALSTIFLPAVTSIGTEAFHDCNVLTTVSLPAATSIGSAAFYSCTSITAVSLPAATSIGAEAFYDCNVLTTLNIPSVTSLGYRAFMYCSYLATISLPAATSIGDLAFYYCDSLVSVSAPVATSIGNFAFYYCDSIPTISLPLATSIGNSAFEACQALTTVSLPLATSIGNSAFYNCRALSTIFLPVATSIGTEALHNCFALTTVALPVATSIGSQAFSYCTALTSGVYLNAPLSGLNANALTNSSVTTIHLRPAPNTPAGWTIGAGQTIKGKSGITVVADWTTYPNLP